MTAEQNVAAVVNYTASATALTLYGLSISEIGVIISSAVAVCGLILQIYLAIRKERKRG